MTGPGPVSHHDLAAAIEDVIVAVRSSATADDWEFTAESPAVADWNARELPGEWGPQPLQDAYRTGLGLCESHPNPDITLTIIPGDAVTADDVIVVRSVMPDRTMYYAFVRQGDVVAELAFYDGSSEATAIAVTARAAQRLCAAVSTC